MDKFERALIICAAVFLVIFMTALWSQHQLDASRYYECVKTSQGSYAEARVLCQRPRN